MVSEIVSRKLFIRGEFPTGLFTDWIINRAARLSLGGWVRVHEADFIEICVSGNSILVDALEVACSLGPIQAQIASIESHHTEPLEARQLARFDRYSSVEMVDPKHIE